MALSVGFIGVGNMGNPMAGNVLKAGFSMTVFDMNPKAMENLIQAGAKRAASAKEVVDASDVVLTSLPASPDVEAMYLDEGGLVQRAARQKREWRARAFDAANEHTACRFALVRGER